MDTNKRTFNCCKREKIWFPPPVQNGLKILSQIADVIRASRHLGLTGWLFRDISWDQRCCFHLHSLCAAWHRRVRWCAVIGGEQFISWPHSWFQWSASCCLACVVRILGKPSLLSNQPTKFSIHSPKAVLHLSVCTQTHSQSVTWDHRQEATLDYQYLTLQSFLNSLKAHLSNI